MDAETRALLDDLLPYFQPDPGWLEETETEFEAIFSNRPVEVLPFPMDGKPIPGHEQGRFTMAEQFHEPARMFYEHLRGMASRAQVPAGSNLPRLRANLGVGFIPSIFGVEQVIFDDKMPWPNSHPSKAELARLEPSDLDEVSDMGLVPYARAIYDLYEAELGTHAFSFLPDTQGVLDIAHIVRGDEVFTDPFDDPPFMHHLMELSLAAYVNVTKHLKAHLGEPLNAGNHGGVSFIRNGGVRYCMDTSVLCREDMLREFELPYLKRALEPFGGGWVHFCGDAPHVVELLAGEPLVRGVNPNYMEYKPEHYQHDLELLRANGKFLHGAPFKAATESLPDYFDRLLAPLTDCGGLLVGPRGPGLGQLDTEAQFAEWLAAHKRKWS